MKKVLVKIIVILLVILASIVAFLGIFKKENGVWKNLVSDYTYGMDVKGARELVYAIDTTEEDKYVYVDDNGDIKGEVWKDGTATTAEEEQKANEEDTEKKENDEEISYKKETRKIKANNDEDLTKENFEKSKKIIQKRLNDQDLGEYNIRIDDVTGKLVIENANSEDEIDLIGNVVKNKGKFQIKDYQNGLILMDNSDIQNISVVYSNEDSKYNTYLQIEFNKEGKDKLLELSKKYVETKKDENSDENKEGEEDESTDSSSSDIKYVSVIFDDETLMTTYFGEEMTNGLLQISVGEERTKYEEFVEDHDKAQLIADTLNSGILPIKYDLETDNFVKSAITKDTCKKSVIIAVVVFAVISVIYIYKFKAQGCMAAILNVGYIAFLSLICKYTNVEITINSMVCGFLMIIMNYLFVYKYLKELQKNKNAYATTSKRFYLGIIPLMVVSLVFTLQKNYLVNSIGMIVFWGLIVNILFNLIFTKNVIKREN